MPHDLPTGKKSACRLGGARRATPDASRNEFNLPCRLRAEDDRQQDAADKVIEFFPPGSDVAIEANKVFLKETEKKKYRPSTIVKQMKAEGFTRFGMQQHTDLWRDRDAKNQKYSFGTEVEGNWFWYESWMNQVRKHCQDHEAMYKPPATPPKPVTGVLADGVVPTAVPA